MKADSQALRTGDLRERPVRFTWEYAATGAGEREREREKCPEPEPDLISPGGPVPVRSGRPDHHMQKQNTLAGRAHQLVAPARSRPTSPRRPIQSHRFPAPALRCKPRYAPTPSASPAPCWASPNRTRLVAIFPRGARRLANTACQRRLLVLGVFRSRAAGWSTSSPRVRHGGGRGGWRWNGEVARFDSVRLQAGDEGMRPRALGWNGTEEGVPV